MDDLTRLLLERDDRRSGQVVYGVASGDNTVAVRGAATAVELPALIPVKSGDYCAVWESGADRLILGPVGGTQHGTTSGTLNGSSQLAVTFPTAFPSTPTINVSLYRNNTASHEIHMVARSTTGFTVQVTAGGANISGVSVEIHWIAHG